jgi:hypothetical protein
METLYFACAMLGSAGMVVATAGFPGVPPRFLVLPAPVLAAIAVASFFSFAFGLTALLVDEGPHPFAQLLDTFEADTFAAPDGHVYQCRMVEPRAGVLELHGCRRSDG